MSLDDARQILNAQFSDSETLRLIEFLEAAEGTSRSCTRPEFPTFAVFQNLHKLLFGTSDIRAGNFGNKIRWDFYPIIKEVPRIKKMIQEFFAKKDTPKPVQKITPVRVVSHLETQRRLKEKLIKELLECPDHLSVAQHTTGKVTVTKHAWQRFVARYCHVTKIGNPHFYDKEHFIRQLQRCFSAAHEKQLSVKGEIKRLFANRLEAVRYFYYAPLNLRFVVLEERPALLTVEIANRW